MIKKITALVCAAAMLLICSGCSLNFFSVESLMSPPTQSGKNGEVQKAFKKLMTGKNIQLKTPAKGDYQSAYVLFDINNDSVEEALVFYTDSTIDASVRMALLECINDTWVLSADVKGAGSGIYDVSFYDLNYDGKYEIFVGWSLFDNQTTKVVSVYDITPGETGIFTLNTLGNEYYNEKSYTDFNGDGKTDLVLVYLDDSAAVQKSYFRCFSLSENSEFVKYGEVRIDSSISSVAQIQSDTVNVDDSVERIFIDCMKTDSTMFTEMIYWDSHRLKPVRGIKKPAETTLRSSRIYCRDIDGDGILEIPANTMLYGDEKALSVKISGVSYTFTMLKWLNTYGDKSEGNITTLFNPVDSYLYRITRNTEVTVRYDIYKQSLLFCKWDEAEKVIKDELFSITYRDNIDNEEELGDELYSADSGVYYYSVTSYGDDFGITDEGIKSSFIIIN